MDRNHFGKKVNWFASKVLPGVFSLKGLGLNFGDGDNGGIDPRMVEADQDFDPETGRYEYFGFKVSNRRGKCYYWSDSSEKGLAPDPKALVCWIADYQLGLGIVYRSVHITYSDLAGPLFPGLADLNKEGPYMAYGPPLHLFIGHPLRYRTDAALEVSYNVQTVYLGDQKYRSKLILLETYNGDLRVVAFQNGVLRVVALLVGRPKNHYKMFDDVTRMNEERKDHFIYTCP